MTQMTRVIGPGGNPLRWKYRPKRATVSALSHGWSILEHRGIAGCAIVAAGVATNSEVRSSAGQPDEEGVVKPVEVVHEIPTKEAKENSGVKQD